jgi:glycosyltransferase involved in cell wall biosynthesis
MDGLVRAPEAEVGPDDGESSFTLVSLAAVTWDFRLVGRTRMLTEAWLRLGHQAIFVQVPSYRTALQRVWSALGTHKQTPVVRPWPPTYPSSWWCWMGERRLGGAIRRRAVGLRRELDRHLSWDRAVALVVSPLWTPWLNELPFRYVVYDCIDALAVHVWRSELTELFQGWEDRLVARASGAVVTAERLGQTLRARRPDLPVALIRNGVNADQFRSQAASSPRPGDMPRLEKPVVGFVGALYRWIDWELIRDTARQLPDYQFVFVGPRDGRSDDPRIRSLSNVRLLGPRRFDQVPAYLRAFDVCWVPFKQDEVGAAANPVKIYEYLALGKPVVTTPVADTESFGNLVAVVRTSGETVARLREAMHDSPAAVEARMEYARQNAWTVRARDYIRFLASLDARTPDPGGAV